MWDYYYWDGFFFFSKIKIRSILNWEKIVSLSNSSTNLFVFFSEDQRYLSDLIFSLAGQHVWRDDDPSCKMMIMKSVDVDVTEQWRRWWWRGIQQRWRFNNHHHGLLSSNWTQTLAGPSYIRTRFTYSSQSLNGLDAFTKGWNNRGNKCVCQASEMPYHRFMDAA